MPVSKGKDCVSQELHRWKHTALHSGTGKRGQEGKKIPYPGGKDQALAVALSVCGKSKYAETLMSMGYSEEVAEQVVELFSEIDWGKQFRTGEGPGPEKRENYETGLSTKKGRGNLLISGTGAKGNMGKLKVNNDAEMLSGPALPKGPGNPQSGSSKEVFGMRALG